MARISFSAIRLFNAITATLAAALCTSAAVAQTYPARVIEMVNPYAPGAATDTMGRALAEAMSAQLGQRIVMMNKPGANGAIGTASVARAAPEGYSVLFTAAVSMVVNPLTQDAPGYTIGSFDHICQTFRNEMVIVVNQDSPLKTVNDLIELGRSKPGTLNYGVLGIGSIPHLAMVELSNAANAKFNVIPFKGDADVMQQMLGGHTDFGVVVLASAARSNLRILGLFSKNRNPGIPDVKTVREQGFDVAPASIGGLSAPAGLPAETKRKLEDACKAAASSEGYTKIMKSLFQPDDYYADSAAYKQALDLDSKEKQRLLDQLGMLKK